MISAWLNEPGVEPLERARRGLVEQLYSAREVKRLKLPDSSPTDDWWLKVADDFGWSVTWENRKPVVDGTMRPSIPAGISRLIVDDEERKLGRALWSRPSAVTHVSWWGVNWAIMLPGGEPDEAGFVTVDIGTDQAAVAERLLHPPCAPGRRERAGDSRRLSRRRALAQSRGEADQLAVALLRMKRP